MPKDTSSNVSSNELDKPSSWTIARRLLKYLKPHRKKFILAIIAMAFYGATDGVIPFMLKHILDKIFGERDVTMLYLIPGFLVLFSIFRAAVGFAQQYLSASVGLSIIQDIRDDINQKLLTLSPRFFNSKRTGNLIARMTNDTLLVRTALADGTSALLRDTIRIIALVFSAIYLDPTLGLLALVLFPIATIPIVKFGRRVRTHSRVGQDQFGGLTSNLQETITGYKVVQAFNLQKFIQNRFANENSLLTKTLKKAERYGALSGPTNEALASIVIAAVLFYGGSTVISGSRTQGQFMAFLVAVFLMYEPAKKLGRVNNSIQTGLAAAERIFEILDQEPDIREIPNAPRLKSDQPDIEFRDVSFSYGSDAEKFVVSEISEQGGKQSGFSIEGINLSVKAGETLALVGPSGGGKSTLANMLPRFYDPTDGQILISGVDIKNVSLTSLRDAISIVDQNTFLFNDSVYNNIAFGDQSASESKIRDAAKAANADTFIEKMPEGYQTVIGEQGLTLSGGQRARLAIARALLKDAPILVLDEATAALDSESEHHVQQAIERLMKGRTTVVIAHRLATIRSADQIAVIEDGHIVELGGHQDLIKDKGVYYKLHSMQFSDSGVSEKVARAN